MSIEKKDDCMTVRLSGHVTEMEAAVIQNDIFKELDENIMTLTIDCTDLKYLSSAGLRVLLKLQKEMDLRDGDLILEHVASSVMEILRLSGFADFLDIRTDEG